MEEAITSNNEQIVKTYQNGDVFVHLTREQEGLVKKRLEECIIKYDIGFAESHDVLISDLEEWERLHQANGWLERLLSCQYERGDAVDRHHRRVRMLEGPDEVRIAFELFYNNFKNAN